MSCGTQNFTLDWIKDSQILSNDFDLHHILIELTSFTKVNWTFDVYNLMCCYLYNSIVTFQYDIKQKIKF
jgi:hypothetical protein